MQKAKAKAPGKLYIAGEYAVVEPGCPAVVVAVDRFITVALSPSDRDFGTLESKSLSDKILRWKRESTQIVLEETNEKAGILLKTLEVTEHYLNELGYVLPYYDITVSSTLDSKDGRKYGLGSSGAVTVAAVKALLASVSHSLSDEEIYKLAAIVHIHLHSRGSLGDLAAASYTGWVVYASPDKNWVAEQLPQMSLASLIRLRWPNLYIEPLPEPESLHLLVGWTGIPASTESHVSSVQKTQEDLTYKDFLNESKACVARLAQGIKKDEPVVINQAIRTNRELLLKMSQAKNMVIETPLLNTLVRIAERHRAAAKSSGAGGGDCGIALVSTPLQKNQIYAEWQANNIEPLSLFVYDKSND